MVWNAEQHRQRRALQKYARNAAGKLVRTAAFRACDYTETGLLHEFCNEDAILAFELERYSDGSGYQVKFSNKPRATVPQEQLALQASLERAIEEDGNQTRVQLTSVEEGLHARLDDISQRLDALRQPNAAATSALAAPGDLQLMARVQKAFKVARMNVILKECKVERQPGMKMADKAALIVEKIPRDRLLNFLENPADDAPAKKKSRTEPIVLPSGASTSLARYFHNTAASPDAKGQLETTLAANACPSIGALYEKHVLSSGASVSTTATREPLSPISSIWSGDDLLEEPRPTAWWQKPSVGTWHSMHTVANPQRRAKLKASAQNHAAWYEAAEQDDVRVVCSLGQALPRASLERVVRELPRNVQFADIQQLSCAVVEHNGEHRILPSECL